MDADREELALARAAALRARRLWCVAHPLRDLEVLLTGLAAVSIDRHFVS
jgi:hypothetical protein